MDSISLKGLIKILLRHKYAILATTLVFIITGAIYGLTAPRKYTATAELQIKPISLANPDGGSDLTYFIDILNTYNPSSNTATYRELIKSSHIMDKTIKKADIPISVDDLSKMVSAEAIGNTDIIKISVTNNDPELAAKIANTIVDVFTEYVSEKNKESAELIAEGIEVNLRGEEEKLDLVARRLRDYNANSANIQLVSDETGVLIVQLSEYKTALYDTQCEIIILQNSYDIILQNRNEESGKNALQDTLLSVETTNLEIKLITSLETEKALKQQISELEAMLSELQAIMADEKYKYESIVREYELSEQAYGAYQAKYKEAVVASASDIGRATVQISSSAVAPDFPEGIGVYTIISVAAVLGFMLSSFFVLFMEYLKTA